MDIERLMDIYYRETLPNKRRGRDSVAFETHEERNLWRLLQDINDRTLQPTSYTFIVFRPVPREIFACDLATRICDHYLESILRPMVERRLIPETFNNRVGMGTAAAVDHLISDIYEQSEGFTRDAWIIKIDMKGYFPNARQDVAYKQMEQVLLEDYQGDELDDLIYLLRCCLYSYPTHHCERRSRREAWAAIAPEKSLFSKPDGTGASIGRLMWQLAMTYYINAVCRWLRDYCLQHLTVYMDDIAMVTRNKEMTLSFLPELRERLAAIGVTMSERKFYCQHWSKGVEFLGYHIKRDRVYVNNRTRRNALAKVRWFNHRISPKYLDAFVASVNSYLGLYKNTNGHRLYRELLDAIDQGWAEMVEEDKKRMCIVCRKGWTARDRVIQQFNLQHYDRRKRNFRGNLPKGEGDYRKEELSAGA